MICLYGYSHSIDVIALLLCVINITLLHYIVLGYALANRILFLIGNISKLHISASKKTLVSGLVIG